MVDKDVLRVKKPVVRADNPIARVYRLVVMEDINVVMVDNAVARVTKIDYDGRQTC